jgi:opacity protein-like surface antigen
MGRPVALLLASFAFVLAALAPDTLPAQGRAGGVELGFDGGVEFRNNEDLEVEDEDPVEFGDETRVGLPIQRFRVGYHASDVISIEPSIGLDYLKVEDPTDDADDDDVSATDLDFGLAILIHFRADPDNPVAYALLRPAYHMTDLNVGDDEDDNEGSQSQFGLAGGIGVKLPIADRLDVRLEGAYERRFEKDEDLLPSSNNYQINVGFSWYTSSR